MRLIIPILAALLLTACGIVDEARDAGREVKQAVAPEPKPAPTRVITIGADSVKVDTIRDPRPPRPDITFPSGGH